MANETVERRGESPARRIDPRDEPSAEWGWHGTFPRAYRAAGWFIAFAMFMMLIGNHEGNVENIWLVAIGLSIVGLLLFDIRRQRTSWRR